MSRTAQFELLSSAHARGGVFRDTQATQPVLFRTQQIITQHRSRNIDQAASDIL
eukprot:COSAG02_NODE_333_length_24452_cov_12.756703_11_plen_54_part_00